MKKHLALSVALLGTLFASAACQQPESLPIDRTPVPSMAASPYICDYVPLDAVRLMTGIRDPIVDGDFDMTVGKELDGKNYGTGSCHVYQPNGNKPKVLQISLSPAGSAQEVEWEIGQGAQKLPEIVPGAVGFYSQDGSADNTQAAAMLVRGQDRVIVELVRGVKGRDNTADVVAMMKLVAPKLIPDASPAPKKTKD
ncbi:hypothetical protein ACFOY2_35795 [Nonomuraea purpurea]|uniref:DUF3558 domain-containing protein n=1 Tax=Nonomuraea purpurea TaxID=1849276 RepID=A0ABV8GJV9_9ACTN